MVPFTRVEKQQRIREMYEAGHTIRDIASEVHMNFSDISAVIKKATGENNREDSGNSTTSEAFITVHFGSDDNGCSYR